MVHVPGGDDCPFTGALEVAIQTTAASPAAAAKTVFDTANDFFATADLSRSFLNWNGNFAENLAKDKGTSASSVQEVLA
jgi:hypothetical protein